jgi:hypothetical protein
MGGPATSPRPGVARRPADADRIGSAGRLPVTGEASSDRHLACSGTGDQTIFT